MSLAIRGTKGQMLVDHKDDKQSKMTGVPGPEFNFYLDPGTFVVNKKGLLCLQETPQNLSQEDMMQGV